MTQTLQTRTCPFEGCDWSHEYDPDDYSSTLTADFCSETHYEREHAGRVRVRVVLEYEQMLGGRTARDVADAAHERFEENDVGADLAYTYAEILEESDDHDRIEEATT